MKKLTMLLASLLLSGMASAGTSNDVPSCYSANHFAAPEKPARELFILIDQTTALDQKLQNSVRENVGDIVKQDTSFVVASFSSFGQGKYVEVISAGKIEPLMPEDRRNETSVKALHKFDACMNDQVKFGRKAAAIALNKALEGIQPDLAKSDIVAGLKELSGRVTRSEAKEKIVLIVSDMLENSSLTSFYGGKSIRQLKVDSEIEKIANKQMFGDFAGARIYVLGAGLMSEDSPRSKEAYRTSQSMEALQKFWLEYFKRSNSTLVEFGRPALLNPIR